MLKKLRRKKKPEGPAVSRSEFLRLKPVRNPLLKWEKDEKGDIKLLIPLREDPAKKRVSGKIFSKLTPQPPKDRKIQLDKVGSVVWELCDGNATVKEIVEALHEKYKMMPSEAEISLDAYFKQLSKRGLVGFLLPEELRERLKEEAKDKDIKK